MSNLHPRLELRHRVRLDPARDSSWTTFITESIVDIWARRGIDPGGDRAFAVDPAGEMRVTLHDPDGKWSRWSSNAYTHLEGTPIRLELFPERDTNGVVYFSSFTLWGGWIEKIEFKPNPGGMNRAVLHCLGPIAQAARIQLDITGLYQNNFKQVIEHIEAAWGRRMLEAPTLDGRAFGVWWQQEGETVMEALSTATVADGGRIFEGRSLQIRIHSSDQINTQTRFLHSQVLLVDSLQPPTTNPIGLNARRKAELDNARATTPAASWTLPVGYNTVAAISGITVQPPENVVLNKVLWNVDAATKSPTGSVWTSAETHQVSAVAPTVTVIAEMPSNQIVVNWVTPVEGTHFVAVGGAVTVAAVKTATRMTVTFTNTGATNVTISTLDFHGELIVLDRQHAELTSSDTSSVAAYGERMLTWRNRFYVDNPSSSAPDDRREGQLESTRMIAEVLFRYSDLQMRTFVDVDANLAGRWAVEELSVPHARVRLDAQRLHLGVPEDHWIRGWQYAVSSGNRAKMRLILEPVVTTLQTDIITETSLIDEQSSISR